MNRGDFIGFYNNTYHYDVRMPPGWMPRAEAPQRKTICRSCLIRWLWPAIAERQDGLCWVCYREQFEGMDDIPLERSER